MDSVVDRDTERVDDFVLLALAETDGEADLEIVAETDNEGDSESVSVVLFVLDDDNVKVPVNEVVTLSLMETEGVGSNDLESEVVSEFVSVPVRDLDKDFVDESDEETVGDEDFVSDCVSDLETVSVTVGVSELDLLAVADSVSVAVREGV